MASEHWFRWHHGTVTDPKWRVVAARASAAMSRNVTVGHVVSVWAAMLECASQANPRGELSGWCDEDIAAAFDYEEAEVAAIRCAMQGKALDGATLAAWNRRQIKVEDVNAADRKRRQRERESELVTERDAPGKDELSRHVTACHDRGEERREEKEQELQGGSATAEPPKPGKSDPIPYQAIVDAFNERLTGLARVRSLTNPRKTAIRSAWNSLPPEHRKIGALKAIFAECALDDFLNGTGPYSGEHANWRPDFDHLIKIKTVTKVYEKAMARRERMRPAAASTNQPGTSA